MNNSKWRQTTSLRQLRMRDYVVLGALALLMPAIAGAASWEIDPVRVELSAEQPTAAIKLKNDTDQPTSIQIQAVTWSQHEGKDVYTPTRELLVSPPIVTIPARSEQVVRAALRRQADPAGELAYRINLQELPPPPAHGFMGLQVALRIGLPVFVQSQKGDAAPKLVWIISRTSDDKLKVVLQNQGAAHVQVSDFSVSVPGNPQPLAGVSGSSYVLAGQSREWLLTTGNQGTLSAGRVRLQAFTDAGDLDTELELGKP